MNISIEMRPKDFRIVTQSFKEEYPSLVRRGISFEPYDHMSVIVYIPERGKLIYEYFGDKITWLEHWPDEQEIKQREKEQRPDMYETFRSIVMKYMKIHQMTHQEFADMVGISRWSLSKYLNGDRIPKVSTMRQICKAINIDI